MSASASTLLRIGYRCRSVQIAFVVPILMLFCGGCANEIAAIENTRFPGDLHSEAEQRCLERRGDERFVPQRRFRTDGCTLWFDGDWQNCCVEHDMDYWCGGTGEERKASDAAIRDCVAGHGHPVIGTLMAGVIRVTGSRIFPTYWRWGYGWPWPGSMERPLDAD